MDNQHSIGDNSHGFVNEQLLVKELNGKKYKELNTCLKNLFRKYAQIIQLLLMMIL